MAAAPGQCVVKPEPLFLPHLLPLSFTADFRLRLSAQSHGSCDDRSIDGLVFPLQDIAHVGLLTIEGSELKVVYLNNLRKTASSVDSGTQDLYLSLG